LKHLSRKKKQELLDLLELRAAKTSLPNSVTEMMGTLLPYQLEALQSNSTHKAVIATRRAGKSHAACVALIRACFKRAGAITYYLALTRSSAKRIAWRTIKNLVLTHKIQASFSESELMVTFKNGSTIQLYGVNQENLLDNLRGTPIDLAVLDEAGSYRGGIVEELIEEVLEPAFADYNGSLLLIGTPTPFLTGFFFRATQGFLKEFQVFKWDLRNNPHIAQGKALQWVEAHRIKKGWSIDNPKFRREFCGEWVQSIDMQVYKFMRERNIGPLPAFELTHKVLGVDLGFKDDTAFVVLGYNPIFSKKLWVIYTKSKSEMQLAEIATQIKALQEEYDPHSTVVDEGGLGKSIAEDWRTRLGIPCEAAKKSDKKGFIETMNSEFHESNIVVQESQRQLADELLNLTWDDDSKQKENPALANHLTDALLYSWRKAFAYSFSEVKKEEKKTDWEMTDRFWEVEGDKLSGKEAKAWWE
jgi:hypothetical protein